MMMTVSPYLIIPLFGISGGEIILVLLLILILFGPKKIPEIARTLGKGINEAKKIQRDINTEIHQYSEQAKSPVKDIDKDIDEFRKGLKDQEAKTPEASEAGETSESSIKTKEHQEPKEEKETDDDESKNLKT